MFQSQSQSPQNVGARFTAFLSKMANQNTRWIAKQSKLSPEL